MQDEGIGGGYEGIGRQQDFIALLKIKRTAAISRAWVQEVVSNTLGAFKRFSRKRLHFRVY